VDWNNDGKQDLLLTDASRKLYTAINDSTGVPQYQALDHILTIPERSAVFAVDWNNDGRKDLIAGGDKDYAARTGYLYVALNTGTDSEPAFAGGFEIIGGDKEDWGWRTCPLAIDWDGDGKKDVITSDVDGNVKFWANIASDALPAFNKGRHVASPAGSIIYGRETRMCLYDCDDDGRQDLLVAQRDGGIRLYIKNHPPQVVIQSPTTATVGQAISISGTETSDPENDAIQFTWYLTSKPPSSSVQLISMQYAVVSFVADVTGQYQIEASVADGHGPPATARFNITVPAGPVDIWTDGSVDRVDLFYLATQWHQNETDFALDPNGIVDAKDLLLLVDKMR
jgi:FG-GAP-like repeat/Bacterial Ig domain